MESNELPSPHNKIKSEVQNGSYEGSPYMSHITSAEITTAVLYVKVGLAVGFDNLYL